MGHQGAELGIKIGQLLHWWFYKLETCEQVTAIQTWLWYSIWRTSPLFSFVFLILFLLRFLTVPGVPSGGVSVCGCKGVLEFWVEKFTQRGIPVIITISSHCLQMHSLLVYQADNAYTLLNDSFFQHTIYSINHCASGVARDFERVPLTHTVCSNFFYSI